VPKPDLFDLAEEMLECLYSDDARPMIEPKTAWACIECNQMNAKEQTNCCRCGRHR
jgi:hypothetical protein